MLRIKEIIKAKGITAKELAAKIGISEGALSLAINGNPTVETLVKIASALGVTVSELFDAPKEWGYPLPELWNGTQNKD